MGVGKGGIKEGSREKRGGRTEGGKGEKGR